MNTSWERGDGEDLVKNRSNNLKEVFVFQWVFTVFYKSFCLCIQNSKRSPEKEINVFNLELTRWFSFLLFYFHAVELLFSISPVPDTCITCKRCYGTEAVCGSSCRREVAVFFGDLGYNRKREGLFMTSPLFHII